MRVLEIFQSIDGEVNCWGQGTIATFIRFSGCNLKCPYCDTKKSQVMNNGQFMTVQEILETVKTDKVTITGGEPMCQDLEDLKHLIFKLKSDNRIITIETNGTYSLYPLYIEHDRDCSFIIDYKIDDSFKVELSMLREYDWIKIPIRDELDYGVARDIVKNLAPNCYARFAFSPIGVDLEILLENMISDGLHYVALNVQLHKLLKLK